MREGGLTLERSGPCEPLHLGEPIWRLLLGEVFLSQLFLPPQATWNNPSSSKGEDDNYRLILPNTVAVKPHRKQAILCIMYSYHLWWDKALYRSGLFLELLLMLWGLPNKYYPDAVVPRVSGQAFINSLHAISHWFFFFFCENFRSP